MYSKIMAASLLAVPARSSCLQISSHPPLKKTQNELPHFHREIKLRIYTGISLVIALHNVLIMNIP